MLRCPYQPAREDIMPEIFIVHYTVTSRDGLGELSGQFNVVKFSAADAQTFIDDRVAEQGWMFTDYDNARMEIVRYTPVDF
jgi:hypothetical protein